MRRLLSESVRLAVCAAVLLAAAPGAWAQLLNVSPSTLVFGEANVGERITKQVFVVSQLPTAQTVFVESSNQTFLPDPASIVPQPNELLPYNIIFLPRILAPTVVGVLWFYVYAPDGVLNRALSAASGSDVDIGWLYQDNTVTGAIIATFVWQSVGLVMVLILLGLAAIPRDPIEAATVDGASPLQVFRHITLPLLLPTLLVVTILSVLAGFTAFDLLWVMGVPYPGQRTLSLAVFMYFEAFQKGAWAFGSAIAVVIGIVVLSVTWIQAAMQNRIDKMTK